jgi:spermidine/putrescine transport system permease protein
MSSRSRTLLARGALVLPGALWTLLLVVVPLGVLFVYSFYTAGFFEIEHTISLHNYRTLVDDPVFPKVLWRTVRVAVIVTLACALLGFPIALTLARAGARARALGTLALMIPLWSNYLVKIYSWKAVLGTNGVINYVLEKIGLISHPLGFLLYDTNAVAIALTSAFLPFMVLPILTALERIPPSLAEAATDLYSSPRRAFWTVTLPMARRGILAGSSFVLVMSMGDIIASDQLGGPSGLLVGRLIFNQFGAADDWPAGAAMSYILIAVMLLLLFVTARLAGLGTRERMTLTGGDARLEG